MFLKNLPSYLISISTNRTNKLLSLNLV